MTISVKVAPSTIEATTIRKLRTHIIPFVFVLFVISFIDRINIGFAALTMNKALAITSQQFGLLSGVFFWGYFLFEIPSNLLLHVGVPMLTRVTTRLGKLSLICLLLALFAENSANANGKFPGRPGQKSSNSA